MNFIKEELLKKCYWRWTNKLLSLGSQWIYRRFGSNGCNTIANLSLLAILVWTVIGMIAIVAMKSIVSLIIALFIFLLGIIVIFSILLMSVANAEKSDTE